MKVVKQYPDNIFCWIDLTTTDLAAAETFYSGLFGWEIDSQPLPGGGSYTNFRVGGHTVAGGNEMFDEMKASGAPPVWNSYVKHTDIDSVAARAEEAGGVVFFPPMDVMDVGRMAMLQDPTGAVVGLWQPNRHIGAEVVNQPNTWTWNELQTRDKEKSLAFYNKVFGWKDQADDSGYVTWQENDRVHCGAFELDEKWGDAPANWMVYFLVEDVDAIAARAAELGGTVVAGPSSAGGLSRFVVIADPQGAHFGAIKYEGPADTPPGELSDA